MNYLSSASVDVTIDAICDVGIVLISAGNVPMRK